MFFKTVRRNEENEKYITNRLIYFRNIFLYWMKRKLSFVIHDRNKEIIKCTQKSDKILRSIKNYLFRIWSTSKKWNILNQKMLSIIDLNSWNAYPVPVCIQAYVFMSDGLIFKFKIISKRRVYIITAYSIRNILRKLKKNSFNYNFHNIHFFILYKIEWNPLCTKLVPTQQISFLFN